MEVSLSSCATTSSYPSSFASISLSSPNSLCIYNPIFLYRLSLLNFTIRTVEHILQCQNIHHNGECANVWTDRRFIQLLEEYDENDRQDEEKEGREEENQESLQIERIENELTSLFHWPVFEMAEYEALRGEDLRDLDKICVIQNLPGQSAQDLEKIITLLFASFGTLSFHLPQNSKGLAFVEFESQEKAKRALKAIDGFSWSCNIPCPIEARLFADYGNTTAGFSNFILPCRNQSINLNEEQGVNNEDDAENRMNNQTIDQDCLPNTQKLSNMVTFHNEPFIMFNEVENAIENTTPSMFTLSSRILESSYSLNSIRRLDEDLSDIDDSISSDTDTEDLYMPSNEDDCDENEEENDLLEGTSTECQVNLSSTSNIISGLNSFGLSFQGIIDEPFADSDRNSKLVEGDPTSAIKKPHISDSAVQTWSKYQEDLLNRNRAINMQFLHAQDQILKLQQENFHFRKAISTAQLERDTAKLEAQNLTQRIATLEYRAERQSELLKEFRELRRDLGSSEMKLSEMADNLAKNEIVAAHLRTRLQRLTGNQLSGLDVEDLSRLESVLLQSLDKIRSAKDQKVMENQKKLARQAEAHEEIKLCVVCLSNDKSVVCLPCRHFCLCKICSNHADMKRCPVCRNDIRKLLSVYS